MIEAHGLYSHLHFGATESDPSLQHVVVPLLGRFKNEDGSRYHLMLCSSITASGFKIREWVEKLSLILRSEKRLVGPAFCHKDGSSYSSTEINEKFHVLLERVRSLDDSLLPHTLDICEDFNIYRSLRRGSTARAMDTKVPKSAIDLHNRWRTTENTKGQRVGTSMSDYYTDLRLTINLRLQYTKAL